MIEESNYTAKNIRIAGFAELEERFCFHRVSALAKDYPHVSKESIERLMTAAETSGEDWRAVVRRYCDGDKDETVSEEFIAAYRELVESQRWR